MGEIEKLWSTQLNPDLELLSKQTIYNPDQQGTNKESTKSTLKPLLKHVQKKSKLNQTHIRSVISTSF